MHTLNLTAWPGCDLFFYSPTKSSPVQTFIQFDFNTPGYGHIIAGYYASGREKIGPTPEKLKGDFPFLYLPESVFALNQIRIMQITARHIAMCTQLEDIYFHRMQTLRFFLSCAFSIDIDKFEEMLLLNEEMVDECKELLAVFHNSEDPDAFTSENLTVFAYQLSEAFSAQGVKNKFPLWTSDMVCGGFCLHKDVATGGYRVFFRLTGEDVCQGVFRSQFAAALAAEEFACAFSEMDWMMALSVHDLFTYSG